MQTCDSQSFISIQTKVVTFTPIEGKEDLGRRPLEVFMSEAEAEEAQVVTPHPLSLLWPCGTLFVLFFWF